MDTRTVVAQTMSRGIQRDYHERVIIEDVERYVFITSRREGSRTILIQSIALGPTDQWRLFEKLPEVFSRFCTATFGEYTGWSDVIAVTVHEVLEALEGLNSPQRGLDYQMMWPRNFTFMYRRGVEQDSWHRINYC